MIAVSYQVLVKLPLFLASVHCCSSLAVSNDAGVDQNLPEKAFLQNANRLRAKICEVHDFVSAPNPDMLLGQETKLPPDLDLLIANYRLHKDDRINVPITRTDGELLIPFWNPVQASYLDPSPLLCSDTSVQPAECLLSECCRPMTTQSLSSNIRIFPSKLQIHPKLFL
ncbi:hypothetical protein TNCV_3819721 [Trichonephila clavipes]|nr:hypothetical protein TNCV_3819721 [Trichonephila clavipes]